MPPLAVQATEDSRPKDIMNEIRRQSHKWTEMSKAVLEARKKCAGLEAQLSKLSMQLFQNIKVHTVLHPGRNHIEIDGIHVDIEQTARRETVSIPEEAEGKKRTIGRRGGQKHADCGQTDLVSV